jgi:hypothetical protein
MAIEVAKEANPDSPDVFVKVSFNDGFVKDILDRLIQASSNEG